MKNKNSHGNIEQKVFVVNKNKHPLMPCSTRKARLLLKAGKAKIIRREPFTIKLTWLCTEYTQQVTAGLDVGTKTMGVATIANGEVLYQAQIEIRQDVKGKMDQRRMYRRTRRGNKTRYRKPRWENRRASRREDRILPSVKSKLDSQFREIKFVESILPVSEWKIELASFDLQKIQNPGISGTGYQNGPMKDFYNSRAYALHRDKYTCRKCGKQGVRFEVHHIIHRTNGGSNFPDNLLALCEECHKKVHSGKIKVSADTGLKKISSGNKNATQMSLISNQIRESGLIFEETFGYETKYKREVILQLPKTHANDAISICCTEGEVADPNPVLYLKKHVSKGDYKQTSGSRSEKKVPTGKLFGLRKFDKIKTPKGTGFVKGKRSSGYFSVETLSGEKISDSIRVNSREKGKKEELSEEITRLSARKTTLIERRNTEVI